MIDEINKVKNQGFTEKELKDMKESYLTDHFLKLETNSSQTASLGASEMAGDWRKAESFMTDVEKATIADLNAAFKKYSTAINWTYLGKESAVRQEDFKQPQMFLEVKRFHPRNSIIDTEMKRSTQFRHRG